MHACTIILLRSQKKNQTMEEKISHELIFNNVGRNIKKLLDERHINMAKLAEHINIHQSTIGRIVSQGTQDTKLSTLTAIANYFDVPLTVLFEDPETLYHQTHRAISMNVPFLQWEELGNNLSIEGISTHNSNHWSNITLQTDEKLGSNAFALPSLESMVPAFQDGSTLVFDPDRPHKPGNDVLFRMKEDNSHGLRKVLRDPPNTWLKSITNSDTIIYKETEIDILATLVHVEYSKAY